MWFPCDPINKKIQMLYGEYLLMPTSLASVEMFVFGLCFLELQFTIPYPNGMQPPVWMFRLRCTPFAALSHVHNWLRLYTLIILLSFIVCFTYYNTRLNFVLSFLVLLVTLVHRNDIDRVHDSYEEQEFWMTRLDWVGIRLNQFEMIEEHENCLSRWK